MAQISIQVDGTVRIPCDMTTTNPCLSISVEKDIEGTEIPYARDTLYLHGSVADVRAFANMILAALPVEVAELPATVVEMPAEYPPAGAEMEDLRC